jgi:septum formation protein
MPVPLRDLPPVILASASPRRAQLLRQIGLQFQVMPSDAPEIQPPFLTPHEVAQFNAHCKARAVAEKNPHALVLGADTLVCVENTILGKPAHLTEARQMLAQLQGRQHHVITGVCLIQMEFRRLKMFAVSTAVKFRSLTPSQIDEYLAAIYPLDKAGAYAIQEQGDWIVEAIEGSFSNVVGLPVERLQTELARWQEA